MGNSKFNQTTNFFVPAGKSAIKAAAVIAHPDDETIWMGGCILLHNKWEWTIYVATHTEEDERGKEFLEAVESYRRVSGNQSIHFNFCHVLVDDHKPEANSYKEVVSKLDKLNFEQYDVVFTHNTDGEYGHTNHKFLGEYFKNKAESEGMNAWHFLCPTIQNPREKKVGECIESIYLNKQRRESKVAIFNVCYLSQRFLWEGFDDFMCFQFNSSAELYMSYRAE